jgi:predicted branched-subunit amino acid permease
MASHRAQLLLTILPIALAFGMQDVGPEIEPLKVRSKTFCIMAGTTKACFPLRT